MPLLEQSAKYSSCQNFWPCGSCTYIAVHACTCARTHACTHASMHARTQAHIHTITHARMPACTTHYNIQPLTHFNAENTHSTQWGKALTNLGTTMPNSLKGEATPLSVAPMVRCSSLSTNCRGKRYQSQVRKELRDWLCTLLQCHASAACTRFQTQCMW